MENTTNPFYIKLSNSLISIVLIIIILYVGKEILVPMSFASLLCILLIKPCDWLEKHKIPRGVAVLICIVLTIAIVFSILYLVSSQIISFKTEIPQLREQLAISFNQLGTWAQKTFHLTSNKFDQLVNNATSETLSHTTSLVGSTVSTVGSTLVYVVLVPIYAFLLLYYRNLVVAFFVRSFKKEHERNVYNILKRVQYVIKGYVTGLFIEMLIVAILNCTGFLILGVKYAMLLGILAAILNLIPYLGIFTACLISMLITLSTNSPGTVLGVAIVLVIVHLLDSNIVLPRVVGSKVKINAMVTILSVIVGSMVWGIPGMFLAIPIIAILKVVFDGVESLQNWGLLLGDETETAANGYPKKKRLEPKDPQVKNEIKSQDEATS